MERFQNTDLPLSSLMGIRQSIRQDDNSTNVKLQSKKKLEELNDMMLERQQSVHRARMIREDINNNLISKLRRVLSKRFNLTREEYIVLIDKFNLKNTNLDRQTIKDMISTLNIQEKYNYDKKDRFTNSVNNNKSNISFNSNNSKRIIEENNLDTEFTESKEKSFDDKLQELIDSRIPQEEKQKKHSMNRPSFEKPIVKLNNSQNLNSKLNIDGSYNNYDISLPVNNIGEQIHFPPPNRETEELGNVPERNMPTLNNTPVSRNNISNNDNIKNTEILSYNPPTQETNRKSNPHIVINEIDYKIPHNNDNIQSSQNNLVIESSLKKILDSIKPTPKESNEKKDYEFNIMTNIIKTDSKNNKVTDSFKLDINYNGKTSITDIKRVELVSCFINENFYKKNEFKNYPYFFMKIKEFSDVLYLNGSSVGGFCQIMWERKGSFYNYINTDKLFGVYIPESDIKLDNLTVELYDHNGNQFKELKSTEADQFNIVLKIVTTKPL
tara:strand:+ start:8039 stop:9529 length:1491 start_codon:yes stop_codon:yes gene_type:complete